MAQRKTLNDVEKFFIENNAALTVEECVAKLNNVEEGVVREYFASNRKKEFPAMKPEQTMEERRKELESSGFNAGSIFAQNRHESGAVVMTEAAGELSDLSKGNNPKPGTKAYYDKNAGHICKAKR